MRFKEWLKLAESGTSTGCIANFARPCLPMVTRQSVKPLLLDDKDEEKKKTKEKKE
jgi:hypothetical protein